jgi:hypothetical protein
VFFLDSRLTISRSPLDPQTKPICSLASSRTGGQQQSFYVPTTPTSTLINRGYAARIFDHFVQASTSRGSNVRRGSGDPQERRRTVAKSVEVPDYEVHGEVRVDPARAALIVVDMQNDFVKEGGSLLVPSAEATIPKINPKIK